MTTQTSTSTENAKASDQPIVGRVNRGVRYWSVVVLMVVLTLPIGLIWFPLTWIFAGLMRIGFWGATGESISHQHARRLMAEHL